MWSEPEIAEQAQLLLRTHGRKAPLAALNQAIMLECGGWATGADTFRRIAAVAREMLPPRDL